jgi:flavorubredoxin
VTKLAEILPWMEPDYHRHMGASKVCHFWAEMVRVLAVDKLVPQHGRIIAGADAVGEFLDWLGELECGIDLVSQALYRPLRMEACSKVRRALKQKYPRYRGYLDAGSQ